MMVVTNFRETVHTVNSSTIKARVSQCAVSKINYVSKTDTVRTCWVKHVLGTVNAQIYSVLIR